MDDIKANLLAVREVLAKGWCQNAHARKKNGEELVYVHHPEAVSWCFLGASQKLYGFDCEVMPYYKRLEAKHFSMVQINDSPDMTQERMLAFIDNEINAL